MKHLATASEIREIDRISIEDWKIPSLSLMETAAYSCLVRIESILKNLRDKKIIIVAGKGNNGGDGYALARQLLNRGVHLTLVISHLKKDMSPDAQFNLECLEKLECNIQLYHQEACKAIMAEPFDMCIDALLGTGITGPVHGTLAELIQFANALNTPIFSIDLPSGMNADVAENQGPHIKANYTHCIGLAKPSLYFSPNREQAGEISSSPIGFPQSLLKTKTMLVDAPVPHWVPQREIHSYKTKNGKLLIYAGSEGMLGAAILTAQSAIKSGVGMVQIATPKQHLSVFQETLPEAMVLVLEENESLVDQILQRCLDWADAIVIGPGLGKAKHLKESLNQILLQINIPVLIDADGLNAINQKTLTSIQVPCVITPHPGEFMSLFKEQLKPQGQPLIEQCQSLAQQHQVVLHLKGAPSLTTSPEGVCYINGTGNPILATAGSGDVLSGIAGAFLAMGYNLTDAMVAASFWHGKTADLLQEQSGPLGHSAMDLSKAIPKAIHV